MLLELAIFQIIKTDRKDLKAIFIWKYDKTRQILGLRPSKLEILYQVYLIGK